MVTANDGITVISSQAMYTPTVPKCCREFGLLFCSVLLKLKPANKVRAGTSRLNLIDPCYQKGAPFFLCGKHLQRNEEERKKRFSHA